jgi:hypothetical protein
MKHQKQKKRVLQDHKKVGQRFIPPFIEKIPNLQEVSYLKEILPEILWIELLSHQVGGPKGVELSLEIARAAATLRPEGHMWLCSEYRKLDTTLQKKVIDSLTNTEEISKLISPLVICYPECPLSFLCLPVDLKEGNPSSHVDLISRVITELYDRRSPRATMMQAGAVYIAFCTDKLQVNAGTPLADFPAIENYPSTDSSRRVAASVRTFLTATGMIEQDLNWARYFWNLGYQLSPCKLKSQDEF